MMGLSLLPGSTSLRATLAPLVVGTLISVVTTTYVSNDKYEHQHKSSSVGDSGRRRGPLFKHDKDIKRYMEIFGQDAMIWRCKNAIQPHWDWKPLPVVELYCEAIGSMRDVTWFHNGKSLQMGHRYKLAMYPHYHRGHYFTNWIDFRLRIYNATHKDSGVYTFELIGKQGSKNTQNVYVDISEKQRKRKLRRWRENFKRYRKDNIYDW